MEEEEDDSVLGIDVGTKKSVVACISNDEVTVLENDVNRRTTPSCATLLSDDLNVWEVGEVAVMQLTVDPEKTFQSAKQYLEAPPGNEGYCHIFAHAKQVVTEILKYMIAQETTHVTTKAAVSVPAYFSECQRTGYLQAVFKTSLKEIILVDDIAAALAAYAYDKECDSPKRVLIIDCGAGGSSVAFAVIKSSQVKILEMSRKHLPAGDHLDYRMLNHIKQRIYIDAQVNVSDVRDIAVLRRAWVEAKEKLSRIPDTKLKTFLPAANQEINLQISRSEFELICHDLFQMIIDEACATIQRAQAKNLITGNQFDRVLLVGGSSRVPYLRRLLPGILSDKVCKVPYDPDEAVAKGLVLIGNNLINVTSTEIKLTNYIGCPLYYSSPTNVFIQKQDWGLVNQLQPIGLPPHSIPDDRQDGFGHSTPQCSEVSFVDVEDSICTDVNVTKISVISPKENASCGNVMGGESEIKPETDEVSSLRNANSVAPGVMGNATDRGGLKIEALGSITENGPPNVVSKNDTPADVAGSALSNEAPNSDTLSRGNTPSSVAPDSDPADVMGNGTDRGGVKIKALDIITGNGPPNVVSKNDTPADVAGSALSNEAPNSDDEHGSDVETHSQGEKVQFSIDMNEVLQFLKNKQYPLRLRGRSLNGQRKNFRRQCRPYFYDASQDQLFYRPVKRKETIKQQSDLTGLRKVIIDKTEQQRLIKMFHEGSDSSLESAAMGGHKGRDALVRALSQKFFWPGLFLQVQRYCQLCIVCKTVNTASLKVADPMHPVGVPTKQMAQIGIDITQMPEANGFKYIIVAIDYFTKWVEAEAIPDKSMGTVARFLYTNVLCRHSCPEVIITDQGREFCNAVNKLLMELCGGKHRITSAYHPQANGLVERMNCTIKRALVKVLQTHVEEWPTVLPGVLFAQRTAVHASSKFSPFFLLYGRHPKFPAELENGEEEESETADVDGDLQDESCLVSDTEENDDKEPFDMEHFETMLRPLEKFRKEVDEVVAKNIKEAQARQKKGYDKRHTGGQVLNVGQEVFLVNQRQRDRKGGKMEPPRTGPYIVHEISDRKTVTLKNSKGEVLATNYPLKDIVPLDVPTPHKDKRKTRPVPGNEETPDKTSLKSKTSDATKSSKGSGKSREREKNNEKQNDTSCQDEGVLPDDKTASHEKPFLSDSKGAGNLRDKKRGKEKLNDKSHQDEIVLSDDESAPLEKPFLSSPKEITEEELESNILQTPEDTLLLLQPYKIIREDISRLMTSAWLNDRIVNAYFQVIGNEIKDVYCFNTFFVKKLNTSTDDVQKWTKNINIFEFKILLVPIHGESNFHWTLCSINNETKVMKYHDSLSSKDTDNWKQKGDIQMRALEQYLKEEFSRKVGGEFKPYRKVHCSMPKQPNMYDCGVFMCFYARRLAQRRTYLAAPLSICKMRWQMPYEILAFKLMAEDFLQEEYNAEKIHAPDVVLFEAPHSITTLRTVSAGMENLGNTCFLSSCLQVLFHCAAFSSWLINDLEHRDKCRERECVTCVLARTLLASMQSNLISPVELVSSLKSFWKTYAPGSQQDAREFLNALFNRLREEFQKRHPMQLDIHSQTTTPVDAIFGFYCRTELICGNEQCREISTSYQHGLQTNISPLECTSVVEGLHKVCEDTKVKDYKCQKCKQTQDATKRIRFETLPVCLIVFVLRFSEDGRKVTNDLSAESTISLKKLLHCGSKYNGHAEYRVGGTVTHSGLPAAGHYVATATTSQGRKLFNDGKVTSTTHRSGIGSDFYIIMYDKV